ncbi:hypothetical protein JTB14_021570 [Gonioctena quinquepunctata]|nr:hypothetical protein JTB14_021570 [Gonioctena quinquepunctata]
MKILKEKYDQESNRNTSDVPSSSGEQASKKKTKKISRKNSKRKGRVLSTSSKFEVDESEIILESEFEVESEVAVSEKGDSTDEEEILAFQNETRDKINIEIVDFTYNPNTKKNCKDFCCHSPRFRLSKQIRSELFEESHSEHEFFRVPSK